MLAFLLSAVRMITENTDKLIASQALSGQSTLAYF